MVFIALFLHIEKLSYGNVRLTQFTTTCNDGVVIRAKK